MRCGASVQAVAGGQDRAQRARRGRILNHPATRPGGAVAATVPEVLRQPARFDQPVQHVLFQLGDRWGSGPQHALHAQPGRDQLGQHRRRRSVGREVPEEAGRLPVGERRNDHPVQVGDGAGQVAPVLGRVGVELAPHPPGLHRGADREVVGAAPIVGHPIDQSMTVGAERRFGQLQALPPGVAAPPRVATRHRLHRQPDRSQAILAPGQRHDHRLVHAGVLVRIDGRRDRVGVAADVDGVDHLVAHRRLGGAAIAGLERGAERGHLVGEAGPRERLGVGGHDGVAKQVATGLGSGGLRIAHADVHVGRHAHRTGRPPGGQLARPHLLDAPGHRRGRQVVQQHPVGQFAGEAQHPLVQCGQHQAGSPLAQANAQPGGAHGVVVTIVGHLVATEQRPGELEPFPGLGQRPVAVAGAVPAADDRRGGDAHAQVDLPLG
jgi:hypothetical protein